MATFNTIARRLASLIAAIGFAASEAVAMPVVPAGEGAAAMQTDVEQVQGGPVDCYAIGEQIAAQNGGRLARATPAVRAGQRVCMIVVLVPPRGGGRPRRMQLIVPAG